MAENLTPKLQKVIEDMKARLKDPDLARLFENAFPSTLDTTVKYFDSSANLAFIITGVRCFWTPDLNRIGQHELTHSQK